MRKHPIILFIVLYSVWDKHALFLKFEIRKSLIRYQNRQKGNNKCKTQHHKRKAKDIYYSQSLLKETCTLRKVIIFVNKK